MSETHSSVRLELVTRAPAVGADFPRRARKEATVRRLLALADCIALAIAFVVARTVGPSDASAAPLLLGLLMLPGWIVLLKLYGLYDRDSKRVSHSTVDDVPWTFNALVVGTVILVVCSEALPGEALTRTQALLFFATAWLGVLLSRAGARALAAATTASERVLFVGHGDLARVLVEKIHRHREYHLEPIGYVDGPAGPAPEGRRGPAASGDDRRARARLCGGGRRSRPCRRSGRRRGGGGRRHSSHHAAERARERDPARRRRSRPVGRGRPCRRCRRARDQSACARAVVAVPEAHDGSRSRVDRASRRAAGNGRDRGRRQGHVAGPDPVLPGADQEGRQAFPDP